MKTPIEARIFTLEEAENLLPQVAEITGRYEREVSDLQQAMEGGDLPQAKQREVMLEIDRKVNSWAHDINLLGAEVKGLWLVDFDSGDGFFYCWKYGEDRIAFMHPYEGSFTERRPVWRKTGNRSEAEGKEAGEDAASA